MIRFLAVALWVLVGAQSAASLALALTTGGSAIGIDPLYPLVPLAWTTVGTLVALRRPSNAIAWLLSVGGLLVGLESLAIFVGVAALAAADLGTAAFAAWAAQWLWVPGFGALALALLLFPDGRPLGRRWARVAAAVLPWAIALVGVVAALAPDPSFFRPAVLEAAPPGPRAAGPLGAAIGAAAPAVPVVQVVTLVAALASLVARFRVGTARERQQVKWLAYASMLLIAIVVLNPLVVAWTGSSTPLGLGLLTIPLAIGVAVLQYRLFDIDVLISRTIAYAALSAASVGLYLAIAVYLHAVLGRANDVVVSALAALAVAVAFQPLRSALQRAVDRLVYGERGRPESALAQLGRRLSGTIATEDVLSTICRTVATTLRLPYVAIALGGERVVAAHGEARSPTELVTIVYQGEAIGELRCSPRSGETRLGRADLALLADLARQAGAAVRSVMLTEELQRARARLVTSREEERRRLRRDLHDELGPRLASQTLLADAAIAASVHDAERTRQLLRDLGSEARRALEDVRALVRGLRPGALEELGLVEALGESAARVAESGVGVDFGAAALPSLPAAVETAAYHIGREAMTNVLRHARATRCAVRLEAVGDHLRISVEDDGVGLAPRTSPGVGFTSMRERAAELGGSWRVERLPAGGTRIEALLPLGERAP